MVLWGKVIQGKAGIVWEKEEKEWKRPAPWKSVRVVGVHETKGTGNSISLNHMGKIPGSSRNVIWGQSFSFNLELLLMKAFNVEDSGYLIAFSLQSRV